MTWVIGHSVPLGYGIMISDIQVSFSDGTTRDCLQKTYQVAADCVIGFAGSVKLGFGQVASLREFLAREEGRSPGWSRVEALREWTTHARTIFQQAEDGERSLGCALLVMCLRSKMEPYHIFNGDPQVVDLYTLRGQAFELSPASDGPVSIGSGNGVGSYRKLLQDVVAAFDPMAVEWKLGRRGLAGRVVLTLLEDAMKAEPQRGISTHLQLRYVSPSGIYVAPVTEEMPDVARSYEDFEKRTGSAMAAGAIAGGLAGQFS